MCSDRTSRGSALPRWGRLYAIGVAAVTAVGLAHAALPPSTLRTAVLVGIMVSTGMVLMRWAASNRVELDLAQWCDCARESTTVRVIAGPDAGESVRNGQRMMTSTQAEPAGRNPWWRAAHSIRIPPSTAVTPYNHA